MVPVHVQWYYTYWYYTYFYWYELVPCLSHLAYYSYCRILLYGADQGTGVYLYCLRLLYEYRSVHQTATVP